MTTKPLTADSAKPLDDRSRDRLGITVGAVILAMIIAMYGAAYLKHQWPAGHPMSGLMWGFIGYMTLRRATRPDPGPRVMYWITLGMALTGAVIWTAATFWVSPS